MAPFARCVLRWLLWSDLSSAETRERLASALFGSRGGSASAAGSASGGASAGRPVSSRRWLAVERYLRRGCWGRWVAREGGE
eukprot:3332111-Prymnesium_polylepis.1